MLFKGIVRNLPLYFEPRLRFLLLVLRMIPAIPPALRDPGALAEHYSFYRLGTSHPDHRLHMTARNEYRSKEAGRQ